MPRRSGNCFDCVSGSFVAGRRSCYGERGKWLGPLPKRGNSMLDGAELEPIKAAVVASTLDGIIMIDQDGRVLALNPAAESMFGFSRAEALRRPIGELIVPEHLRDAHSRGRAAYVAGGEPKVIGKRIEVDALHKDGRIFPVELTVLEINVEGR